MEGLKKQTDLHIFKRAILEKRADGADTSVLFFRLAVLFFLPVDTQVRFFCILL